MGGGTWTTSSFASYSTSKGRSYDAVTCSLAGSYTSQEIYTQKYLNEKLNPNGIKLVQNNGSLQEIKHYHLHIIPSYNKKDNVNVEEVFNLLTK